MRGQGFQTILCLFVMAGLWLASAGYAHAQIGCTTNAIGDRICAGGAPPQIFQPPPPTPPWNPPVRGGSPIFTSPMDYIDQHNVYADAGAMAQAAFMEQTFPQLTEESQQDVLDYLAANPNAFIDAIANGTPILANFGDQMIFLGAVPVRFNVPEIPECRMATVVDPSTLGCTLNATRTGFNCPRGSSGSEGPPGVPTVGNNIQPDPSKLIFEDDFEECGPTLNESNWVMHANDVYTSDQFARDGQCSAHAALTGDSDIGYRTEAIPGPYLLFDSQEEYCISFSQLQRDWTDGMPPRYQNGKGGVLMFQIHSVPGDGDGDGVPDWDCVAPRNPISFHAEYEEGGDDTLRWKIRSVQNQVTGPAHGSAGGDEVYSEVMTFNQWNDFTIRYKPSQGADGIIEVWRNGVKLYEHFGANQDLQDTCGRPINSNPDSLQTYPTMGLYTANDNSVNVTGDNEMHNYYDNFKIARGAGSCVDVSQ